MNDTRPLPPQPGEPRPSGGDSSYPPPGQQYPSWPTSSPAPQGGQPPQGGQAPQGQPGPYAAQQPGPYAWPAPGTAGHAAYGTPPHQQRPPRKGRTILAAVGGGLAGAALTLAVALPIALPDNDTASSSGDTRSDTRPGDGSSVEDLIDRGNGGTDEASEGDASDAGVLLVDTRVGQGEGAGTAMVLTPDGLAVTNYHVVDGSEEVEVTVAATGEEYTADVLGYDATADVAVLQLEDASDLPTVTIDDDGGVDVGDGVTALGNAGGQGFLSQVTGEVTSLDEDITTTDQFNGNETRISGLIETDADVVPGYSGGPMFDDEGEVIGISTAAAATNGEGSGPTATLPGAAAEEGGGISYARPIDEALDIVQLVVDDEEGDGVVVGRSAYLGVGIDPSGGEALVAQAEAGTPAADAGIEAGDVITSVDGERVSTYDELAAAVASHEPGDQVAVTWERDGQEQEGTVTLGESPTN